MSEIGGLLIPCEALYNSDGILYVRFRLIGQTEGVMNAINAPVSEKRIAMEEMWLKAGDLIGVRCEKWESTLPPFGSKIPQIILVANPRVEDPGKVSTSELFLEAVGKVRIDGKVFETWNDGQLFIKLHPGSGKLEYLREDV